MLKRALPAALLLTAFDQYGKLLAVRVLEGREPVAVFPGFHELCHVVNIGASWGIFPGWRWSLAVFATVALTLLAVFHRRVFPPGQPLPATTLALLLGGIAGNLIDRVRIGGVIDFIHLYWRNWSFPVFNVADTCITFGLALYIAGQVASERAARKKMKDET